MSDYIYTEWIETNHNEVFFPIPDSPYLIGVKIPDGFVEEEETPEDWVRVYRQEGAEEREDVTDRFIQFHGHLEARPTMKNFLTMLDLTLMGVKGG